MKYILILLLVLASVHADKVKRVAVACLSIMLLKKAPADDYIEINKYSIANSCVLVSPKDSIEVVSDNSKDAFQKIMHNDRGLLLYIRTSAIIFEKPGKKNIFKF